ncbi:MULTISPECIES: cell division protein CrgA [Microbacteriaceae]|uniref:Cell division protein CrgA n=1 Tax=Paramicrobacterium chengjingii TaxID=2769067 RepID=A0ABX6YIC9_9MICO|nr:MULTISPECIES: cell division protein CrgA [Microbacterium]MCW4457402.1 cell division protein CrgA [Microbacterium sp. MPKO10]QPZ38576.1 cell division protein CrgA [Microbacterium chengjingii]
MARTKNKAAAARAQQQQQAQRSGDDAPNPVWFKPVMFGFMLIGLAWIIVFYLSQGLLPVAALGSWNILVGFGIAFIGFLMTTRWR